LPHRAKKAMLCVHDDIVATSPAQPKAVDLDGNLSNCVLPSAQTDSGLPGNTLMILD
jgi:hypothetical protein